MFNYNSIVLLFHLCLIVCLTSQTFELKGQGLELNRPCQITLKEGTVLNVYILEDQEDQVIVQHPHLGEMFIPWDSIAGIKNESQLFLQSDGNEDTYATSHYFISPSSYGLKKGQMYYENIGIFFNSLTVGVTDRFSISAGGELATFLIGSQVPNFYLSPRFTLPIIEDKLGLSLAAVMFSNFSEGLNGGGFVQAGITHGNVDGHMSLGVGVGYNTTDGITNEQIMPFSISGAKRITEKLSIISDNFYIHRPGFGRSYGIFSAGTRFHFTNGSCVNVGLFRISEKFANLIGLPFVSAVIAIK